MKTWNDLKALCTHNPDVLKVLLWVEQNPTQCQWDTKYTSNSLAGVLIGSFTWDNTPYFSICSSAYSSLVQNKQ